MGFRSRLVSDSIWVVTLGFVIVTFLVPGSSTGLNILVSLVLVLTALVCSFSRYREVEIPIFVIFSFIGLFFSGTLSVLLGDYGGMYLFKSLAALIIALAIVLNLHSDIRNKASRLFLWVGLITIVVLSFLHFYSLDFFALRSDFGSNVENAPLLPGGFDKNRTALFVFLFFALSWYRKFYLGIATGLLYPFVYAGRQYLLLMTVFIAIEVFRNLLRGGSIFSNWFDRITWGRKATLFSLLFLLVGSLAYLGSQFWVKVFVSGGVGGYKQSLNDGSNAMRAYANLYAGQMIGADKYFIFSGLDSSVFEVLGISQSDGGVLSNTMVQGFRLVQPHNEIINFLLKEGLFTTVSFFICLSIILAVCVDGRNFAIFLSYSAGSIVLHEMFQGEFLILVVFVLAATCEVRNSEGDGFKPQVELLPRRKVLPNKFR